MCRKLIKIAPFNCLKLGKHQGLNTHQNRLTYVSMYKAMYYQTTLLQYVGSPIELYPREKR